MRKRTYVTSKRLEQIRASLSDHDLAIISDVARVNVMSGQQIRQLHFGQTSTDRRMSRLHLKRMADDQILSRLGRQIGGRHSGSDGFCYALDVAGQRLVRPAWRRARPPWTPGPHHLAHALAVSQLFVDLRLLESDSCRLSQFDAEPESWRRYFGPGGGHQTLKPDAYVITTSGLYDDCYFVEVDRSTESLTRIGEKLKAYLAYFQSGREQAASGVFPRIIWSVPTEARKEHIVSVISELAVEHWQLFGVALADQTSAHLMGLINERR